MRPKHYRNSWSASLHARLWGLSSISYHNCSQDFSQDTLLKLRCCRYGTLWHTRSDMSALVLLDIVNHSILLQRLQSTFAICDSANRWFQSYLSGRKQHVRRGSARSSTTYLVCGVPQGSVVGPILFVLYIIDLILSVESQGLSSHLYICWWRSSLQWLMFACCSRRALSEDFRLRPWHCGLGEVEQADAEPGHIRGHLVWTSRRQHQLSTAAIPIVGVPITPARSVRDLGIYIDADLSMRAHVKRTVSRCFAAFRQLQKTVSSADSHVPDAHSGSGTLTTRLWDLLSPLVGELCGQQVPAA